MTSVGNNFNDFLRIHRPNLVQFTLLPFFYLRN